MESVSDLAAKTGSGLAAKKVMSPVPVMNTSKNASMSDLKVNDSTADSEMASQIGKPDVKNNGKNYSAIKSNPTQSGNEINKNTIIGLLQKAVDNNIDTIKTENLYAFNGKSAYSLGQGQ